jgi:hypothetical protein
MAWEAFVCLIHSKKPLMWHQRKNKRAQEGLTLVLPPEIILTPKLSACQQTMSLHLAVQNH